MATIIIEGECSLVEIPETLPHKVSRILNNMSEVKNDLRNINEVIGGEVSDYTDNLE